MTEALRYGKPSGKTVKYLEKYFTSPFRTGYVTCGETVLPEKFTRFGDLIREMNIRSDDTWVFSFPRTGTTWTQEMVWCIANNVDLMAAEKLLLKRFPFLDFSVMIDIEHLLKNCETTTSDILKNSFEFVVNLASPRFIKSHLPFQLLPKDLLQSQAKIIYVTRNPRDTCISYFHHCRKYQGYSGDFEQFCELFLEGNVPFGPFWNHVQSYWEMRNEPNVLILKYEDMIKDLKAVIYKTANFLEKSLSEEQVTKLLDHLSFKKMKENPATNEEFRDNFLKKYGVLPENYEGFIRSGKVGGWKEVMDAKMVQRFEEWELNNLKNAEESLVKFFE